MRDDLLRIAGDIVRECAGDRPPQTLILVGEPGSGQDVLAKWIAGDLLGQASFEAHPDYMRVSLDDGEKASIGVDQVRSVCVSLRMSSVSGGWRVLIVDRGDDLTLEAANALLKTIEEPLPKTLVLLVVDSLSSIPATVRSRSRIVRVPRPDGNELKRHLAEKGFDPEKSEAFLFLTDRDEALSIKMMEAGGMEIYDALGRILSDTPSGLSRAAVQAFVEKYGADACMPMASFLVRAYARHLVEAKLFGREIWLPRHIAELSGKAALSQLLKIGELIDRISRDTAEQNLDKRYALTRSCLAFEHGFTNAAG